MEKLKIALSYQDQIERLKTHHNLLIGDEPAAICILQTVNYYRLSGYGIGLKKPGDQDNYRDGITLEHIYRLHEFDSIFRNLMIQVIENLEIQLRTKIAYQLAIKYGAEGYMDVANFADKQNKNGDSIHGVIVDNFKKECDHQKNAPFVKHHLTKYNGHFPIWVAVELFTFGNLSSLFSIMKMEDRKAVAKLFNTDPKYLGSWMLALVEVRNICAHYSRLYNMPLKQRPSLYRENKKYQNGNQNKIFPVLLTIKRMLQGDPKWGKFESEIEAVIDTYSDVVNLSFMGFPKDWKSVLTK